MDYFRSGVVEHSNRKIPREEPDAGVELSGDLEGTLLRGPQAPAAFVRGEARAKRGPLGRRERAGVEAGVDLVGLTQRIVEIDDVVTD